MKKILLFLSIFATFAVGGTALVSSASAATCTNFNAGSITYDGRWVWTAQVYGCNNVNGVEFQYPDNLPAGIHTGIQDQTHGTWHSVNAGGGQVLGIFSIYQAGYANPIWGSGCGSPAFSVYKKFGYRIRNVVGSTWGSWHQSPNVGGQLLC